MQITFRRFLRFPVALSFLLLCLFGNALATYAQSCDPVINSLAQSINECSEINSNWVCYASTEADVKPDQYRFFQPRDRRPFPVLEEVATIDQQGVVLMNLQLKGETNPMKVIVFGPLDVKNGAPTQRTLTVGFSNDKLLCNATPAGIMVQTAERATGVITVNGVDIELGSTAYITLQADGHMIIANIEGHVKVTIGGVTQELLVGQQALVALTNGQPAFVGQPTVSTLSSSPVAQWLASNGLPRVHNTNTTAAQCVGEIKFGQTITTQNVDPGQECLYHFCAQAGDAVTVQMDALDPSLNPWVDLRGPGQWLLAFNDDNTDANLNSLVCNRRLPLTSCDYTIVARSAQNASKGPFKLALSKQSTCVQPPPRCNVVAVAGVGLRVGPGVNEKIIDHLSANAKLQPLERTSDGAWARVQVVGTTLEGWVSQIPGAIECEDDAGLMPAKPSVVATPRSGPGIVIKPTPVPQHKTSPFGTP